MINARSVYKERTRFRINGRLPIFWLLAGTMGICYYVHIITESVALIGQLTVMYKHDTVTSLAPGPKIKDNPPIRYLAIIR